MNSSSKLTYWEFDETPEYIEAGVLGGGGGGEAEFDDVWSEPEEGFRIDEGELKGSTELPESIEGVIGTGTGESWFLLREIHPPLVFQKGQNKITQNWHICIETLDRNQKTKPWGLSKDIADRKQKKTMRTVQGYCRQEAKKTHEDCPRILQTGSKKTKPCGLSVGFHFQEEEEEEEESLLCVDNFFFDWTYRQHFSARQQPKVMNNTM